MDKTRIKPILATVPDSAMPGVTFRSTGGSTGEPFRFPVAPEEANHAALDIWLGRRRLGITPADPMFLLWGHAHLLGSGFRGAINKMRRQVSDRLLGYTRVSAYDLADEDLQLAGDRLIADKPFYAVGYSSALDRFARVNADRARDFATLNLKAVIATAEGFPRADSRAVIGATFGAPVAMEYGAVETGPLAYEDPATGNGFAVFHIHHRLTLRGGDGPAAGEVLVTSLTPRALPLMRYALGDLAVPGAITPDGGITQIARVIGRCNDVVTLPTGANIHSEAFTHCMRDMSGIAAYQVVAPQGDWPRLRYAAPHELPKDATQTVRRRLAVVDPALAEIALERVDSLPLSVAGKHRMVVSD
ncbi:MAG: hypothetical protein AAFW98_00665 [Pseudomonadota bacterium]